MTLRFKKFCTFFILLAFFSIISSLRAAHLVGGDISYTCLGNNNYAVKLRVYRDCAGGGAPFDTSAQVAIYDTSNTLVRVLSMFRGPIRPVTNSIVNDPCITVPANLCVEFTEYDDTVALPPVPGGYMLVHQRCCRNINIDNVTNANSYGNTYSIEIPSMDTTCNNSIQFDGDIEVLSCVNFPTEIEIQYTELDGDSVSFSLCDIYEGGGRRGGSGCNAVVPTPPCPPPFNAVPFQAPQSATDPIPANPAYSIDPQTGKITGTPTQIGNFVLGICATEWRNGKPLSTTRLDYQLAVTNCTRNVRSDMVTQLERPTMTCDGFRIEFESESVNASTLFWDFGDTTTLADTASSVRPVYTFPAAGNYLVTLVANPGLQCSDTTQSIFKVIPPVNPDFLYDGTLCYAAQDVDFEPIGFYPNNSSFRWTFGGDALIPTSNQRSPVGLNWASPGKKPVQLQVLWGNGCSASFSDSIEITQYQVFVDAGPDTTLPRGSTVPLSSSSGATYYWYANSPVRMSDRFARNVEAEVLNDQDTVMFYVLVTDANGCEGIDSVQVAFDPGDTPPIDNVITPNGDGFNEFFDLSDINPAGNCKFTVVNRWGAEVYYDATYPNNWEGTDQDGQPLPEGTYYYVLQCGFEVISAGPITILRG